MFGPLPLPAPRPRWIVFDAVGTLLDPDPPAAVVYHAAAVRRGSRLTLAQVARRLCELFPPCGYALWARRGRRSSVPRAAERGRPVSPCAWRLWRPRTSERRERLRWRKIVQRTLDDVPGQEGRRLFAQLWHHFRRPEHWRLYPEVPQTLAALRRAGYHLAVASNFDRRLEDVVRGHPPLASLDACFVSSELGFSKPDPRFFRAVERHVQAAGQELLLVGDQVECDLAGAAACGWQALLVDRAGHWPGPALRSLAELVPLLVHTCATEYVRQPAGSS